MNFDDFKSYEQKLCEKGSGLTKEQMTGATIFYMWMLKERAEEVRKLETMTLNTHSIVGESFALIQAIEKLGCSDENTKTVIQASNLFEHCKRLVSELHFWMDACEEGLSEEDKKILSAEGPVEKVIAAMAKKP
jgi:hypothetical protein